MGDSVYPKDGNKTEERQRKQSTISTANDINKNRTENNPEKIFIFKKQI
jgi:hypothetical protein